MFVVVNIDKRKLSSSVFKLIRNDKKEGRSKHLVKQRINDDEQYDNHVQNCNGNSNRNTNLYSTSVYTH